MSFSNFIQETLTGTSPTSTTPKPSNDDFNPALQYAESQSQNSDPSLFTSALSLLNQNKNRLGRDELNDEEMVRAHQSLYAGGGDEGQRADANALGAGAAMQALKIFTGSAEGEKAGMDRDAFIGMAMAQALRLYEEREGRGGVSGDKQSAINSAAEMALKMYMKSQGGGLSGTGGPGGLMQLASRFL